MLPGDICRQRSPSGQDWFAYTRLIARMTPQHTRWDRVELLTAIRLSSAQCQLGLGAESRPSFTIGP